MKTTFVFRNWAVKFKIKKIGNRYVFFEANLKRDPRPWTHLVWFKKYDNAYRAMQRYSKRYYGEKAV